MNGQDWKRTLARLIANFPALAHTLRDEDIEREWRDAFMGEDPERIARVIGNWPNDRITIPGLKRALKADKPTKGTGGYQGPGCQCGIGPFDACPSTGHPEGWAEAQRRRDEAHSVARAHRVNGFRLDAGSFPHIAHELGWYALDADYRANGIEPPAAEVRGDFEQRFLDLCATGEFGEQAAIEFIRSALPTPTERGEARVGELIAPTENPSAPAEPVDPSFVAELVDAYEAGAITDAEMAQLPQDQRDAARALLLERRASAANRAAVPAGRV